LAEGKVIGTNLTVRTCKAGPDSGSSPKYTYAIASTVTAVVQNRSLTQGQSQSLEAAEWKWNLGADDTASVELWRVDQSRGFDLTATLQELRNGTWVNVGTDRKSAVYHMYLFDGEVISCEDQGRGR
jgi:hypothetical protein